MDRAHIVRLYLESFARGLAARGLASDAGSTNMAIGEVAAEALADTLLALVDEDGEDEDDG